MSNIKIREAKPEDLPTLLGFEQDIINTERPMDPTLRRDNYHYYDLEQMLKDDDAIIFVAEADDKIIGSGNVGIRKLKHYNNIEEYAHIGLMYTVPGYRGKGVASLVLDAIKQWSIKRGHSELRLHVFDKNISAVKAYEKYGFTKNMTEMRLDANE